MFLRTENYRSFFDEGLHPVNKGRGGERLQQIADTCVPSFPGQGKEGTARRSSLPHLLSVMKPAPRCCVPIGCLRRRCATWVAGPRRRCACQGDGSLDTRAAGAVVAIGRSEEARRHRGARSSIVFWNQVGRRESKTLAYPPPSYRKAYRSAVGKASSDLDSSAIQIAN